MIANITCVPGNDTAACPPPGSPTGLAVGLTLFFLALVIAAGVIVYKYHSTIKNKLGFGHRGSLKKDDYTETPQPDPHQYTSMIRKQSTGQNPIYENLTRNTDNRREVNQSRSHSEPEEDLYLQCDLPDDAIYSNDPACNLSILPDTHEEDVYIIPDS